MFWNSIVLIKNSILFHFPQNFFKNARIIFENFSIVLNFESRGETDSAFVFFFKIILKII